MAYLSPLQWAVNEFGFFVSTDKFTNGDRLERLVNLLFLVFQQKFTH